MIVYCVCFSTSYLVLNLVLRPLLSGYNLCIKSTEKMTLVLEEPKCFYKKHFCMLAAVTVSYF